MSEDSGGTCYESAFQLMDQYPDAVLVHGYPVLTAGPHAGKRFGHAWIEFLNEHGLEMVLDYQKPDHTFVKALFYFVGQIDERRCRKYSQRDARRMVLRHMHYGPWGKQPAGVLFAKEQAHGS